MASLTISLTHTRYNHSTYTSPPPSAPHWCPCLRVINGCSLYPTLTSIQLFDGWACMLDRWTDVAWQSTQAGSDTSVLPPSAAATSYLARTERGNYEREGGREQRMDLSFKMAQILFFSFMSWSKQQVVDIWWKYQ